MDTLWQDLRYGLRMLAKSPGFSSVAILTLALGIGANTAIFSVVNAVLLRPLPYQQPGQLVRVTGELRRLNAPDVGVSVPELFDLRDQAGVFSQISGIYPINANLTGGDQPERVETQLVSPTYFTLLGANAALGRVFGAEDDVTGIAEAVVISDGLWQRRFGGDTAVLGRKVRIDNDLFTVVGVMPPNFHHPGREIQTEVDVWATSGYRASPFATVPIRRARFLDGALARLKPGVTVRSAQARLDALARMLREQYPNDYPSNTGWALRVLPLHEDLVGNVRPAVLTLFAAVGLVLMIACVNVANLLLARSGAREREVAIRLALGATRGRLVRQLLTESALLSLAGGLLGLLLASWSLGALVNLIPADLPHVSTIKMDGAVLAFALGMAILTAILFGLVPALQASSPRLYETLKQAGQRSSAGGASNRVRSALVVIEFALALMLLIGAFLLVRSFWKLENVAPGFNPQHVQTARLWLPQPNNPQTGPYFKQEARAVFYRKILDLLRSLPGVVSAAGINNLPLSGARALGTLTIEGRPTDTAEISNMQFFTASAGYLQTMGIPLLRGRDFTEFDKEGVPGVALVNETMVRRYFPREDPLGKRFRLGGAQATGPWFTIVGVVGDVKHERLDASNVPQAYLSLLQLSGNGMALVLRTGGAFANVVNPAAAISGEVHAVDPEIPVFNVRTMEDVMSVAVGPRRLSMLLVALFACAALVLSAIGIYGVMTYAVEQRTHEIGIRLALGAQPRDILRLVVGHGTMLTGFGVILGAGFALAFTRYLSSLLFDVTATDPVTFSASAALLAVVALFACYLPARRAMKVDPMVALRYE